MVCRLMPFFILITIVFVNMVVVIDDRGDDEFDYNCHYRHGFDDVTSSLIQGMLSL